MTMPSDDEDFGAALKVWREHMDNAVLSGRQFCDEDAAVIERALTSYAETPAMVAAAYEAAARLCRNSARLNRQEGRSAYAFDVMAESIGSLTPTDARTAFNAAIESAKEKSRTESWDSTFNASIAAARAEERERIVTTILDMATSNVADLFASIRAQRTK
jgi:hypothetical protein